ncbi:unnamed protein product [Didymodactylos carnosus]|uniref:MULE transposase domain-containing protein n=1 Tax=Didymodactylos carnosus TaxID=1234261 RepID=A0A814GAI3_9BILA|nr:unnamed protein product [Didymodactylos carnosus]CAF3765588.1 unnamed protein product [Didymodactylos carnosus]
MQNGVENKYSKTELQPTKISTPTPTPPKSTLTPTPTPTKKSSTPELTPTPELELPSPVDLIDVQSSPEEARSPHLVDGTIASAPTDFEQLVIIMGTINDEVVIEQILTNESKRFILDFETAQRNSVERQFVGAEVTGCWFYFCQCLYKHVGQLGLIPSYKDDAAIRTWLRSFMSLPLFDNDIFPYAIKYLQRHALTSSDQCREFHYFEYQWLVSVPIQYWHVGNLNPRSNNWIEGYNNGIRTRFGNHSNIWLFLYHLLIEEQIIKQRVQQLVVGKIQKSGSTRAPENDTVSHSITKLNKKYINGNLDIEKYLKARTYLVGNADAGSANANKITSTAATICPTTTPPKEKPAAKTSTTKTLSLN